MLHVDPQTWTIALSPDRLALVVFLPGEDRSLNRLLSAPVRVDYPENHLPMIGHECYTSIDAMTCAGEPHPVPIAVCMTRMTKCLQPVCSLHHRSSCRQYQHGFLACYDTDC